MKRASAAPFREQVGQGGSRSAPPTSGLRMPGKNAPSRRSKDRCSGCNWSTCLSKSEEETRVPRPERDGKGKRASRKLAEKLAEERELRRAARRVVHRVVHREKGPRKDDKHAEERELRRGARDATATRHAVRREEKRSVLRTFTLVTNTDPGTLMARVKREANERGAEFRGAEASGSFSASGVKGVYRMEGKVVTIDITEKPWYVPWALAESELRRLLA